MPLERARIAIDGVVWFRETECFRSHEIRFIFIIIYYLTLHNHIYYNAYFYQIYFGFHNNLLDFRMYLKSFRLILNYNFSGNDYELNRSILPALANIYFNFYSATVSPSLCVVPIFFVHNTLVQTTLRTRRGGRGAFVKWLAMAVVVRRWWQG